MVGCLLASAGWWAPVRAEPPDRTADALHRQAVVHHNAGRFQPAVDLWLAADRLAPRWKYALNLAKAYHALRVDERCWWWALRTRDRGTPGASRKDLADLERALGECRRTLLATGAILEVTSAPELGEDISLYLDDRRWRRPWRAFRRGTHSRLQVVYRGRVIIDEDWRHPVGARTVRTLALPLAVPASVPGLRAPATGGSLGRRDPEAVQRFRLGPVERPLRPWGWATLISGVAAIAAGTGLVAHAFSLQSDLSDLNDQRRGGRVTPGAYHTDFRDLLGTQDTVYTSGVVLLATGSALAVAGAVLLLVDGGEASAAAVPIPGGAIFRLSGSF